MAHFNQIKPCEITTIPAAWGNREGKAGIPPSRGEYQLRSLICRWISSPPAGGGGEGLEVEVRGRELGRGDLSMGGVKGTLPYTCMRFFYLGFFPS
jgi:hypothetical protein